MQCGTTVFAAFLMVVAAPPSCAIAQGLPDDFLIALERISLHCGGACPAYTVSIDAQSNVRYDGKMYVRVVGPATDRIPDSRVRALAASLDQIGFFKLRDRYTEFRNPDGTASLVDHYQQTFVTVRRNGESKRIEASQGVPPGLTELVRQIDEAARTQRWIRIDVPTLRQLAVDGHRPTADQRGDWLRLALAADEVDVIKALLDMGADSLALSGDSKTPPLMMVRSGAAARALIEAGADPLARMEHGATPLGGAVWQRPDVTEVLLKAGVPADLRIDLDGTTALIVAAANGNIGVVRLLLAAGADPRVRGRGATALEAALDARRSTVGQSAALREMFRQGFVEDFDAVIAALREALAAKPR
jgi:hypothetical protein